MTPAGRRNCRVRFERRGLDDNNDRLGAWEEVTTCAARIQPLKGAEPVLAQRLDGVQPFVIYVMASSLTRPIDNTYRAVNTRSGEIYGINAFNITEDRSEMEFLVTWKAGDQG